MYPISRPVAAAIIGLVGTLLVPSPTRSAEADRIVEAERLVLVAVSYPDSPFVRFEGTQPSGLDFDIVRSFARQLGVEIEIILVDRIDELFATLERGEADVGASGLTITDARRQRVDFSDGYFPIFSVAVMRSDDRVESIDDATGRVAVYPGSTLEQRLEGHDGLETIEVDPRVGPLAAVAAGDADIAFVESPVAGLVLERYPGLDLAFSLPGVEEYGLAVPKGSDLTGPLDRHLEEIRESGIFYRLVEHYFGDRGSQLYLEARRRVEEAP